MLKITKNSFKISAVSVGIIVGSLLFAATAYAATPTVSASATGNGDYVQLNVVGDANSSVTISYLSTSSQVEQSVIGSTNSNGTFSTTISTSGYNITPDSLFYVTVDDQRSSNYTWPYGSSGSGSSNITLSQTSITVSIGQTSVITASNTSGSNLFLSTNSTPSVANASFSGNSITVTANTYGSTQMDVCLVNSTSDCADLSVTVPNSNSGSLSFSQNNVTVPQGQSIPITVSGGDTGNYTISGNTDSAVIQATLTNPTVYLYGNSSSGSATITVCSADMSACGVINATIGSESSSSNLSFSQNNPTITPGQTTSVTVSGGSGTYYISSNPNTSVVTANIVGSTLTLYGNADGSDLINICASGGGCNTITVTVSAVSTQISLSETSVTLSPGQATDISVSGSGSYSVSNNSNQEVATASLNGNVLDVSALSPGSTYISICETGSECTSLYVTVSGTGSSNTGPQMSLVVSIGQTIYVSFTGGETPYYLSSNPDTIFESNLNGSTVGITGVSVGSSSVQLCSANNGGCTPIYVYVTSAPVATPVAGTGSVSANSGYQFENYLYFGVTSEDVTMLQKRLASDGLYGGPVTGYYGSLTESAVKKFQAKYGLDQLGVVGPATRGLLNKGD